MLTKALTVTNDIKRSHFEQKNIVPVKSHLCIIQINHNPKIKGLNPAAICTETKKIAKIVLLQNQKFVCFGARGLQKSVEAYNGC